MKRYYEAHKEKKMEYQKKYYEENKEVLKQKAREKNSITVKKKNTDNGICSEWAKKHKGFKFGYNDGVISFEVTLPFRVMEIRYHVNRIDEEAYKTLDKELKSKLRAIDPTQTIIIFEPSNIQFYSKNIEAIDEVVEAVKEFIKEKTEIYGKYKFRGRYIGIQL